MLIFATLIIRDEILLLNRDSGGISKSSIYCAETLISSCQLAGWVVADKEAFVPLGVVDTYMLCLLFVGAEQTRRITYTGRINRKNVRK